MEGDLDAEEDRLDALREIASKRATPTGASPKAAARGALPPRTATARRMVSYDLTLRRRPPTPENSEPDFFTDKQLRQRWQCSSMKLWRTSPTRPFRALSRSAATGLNLTPRSDVKAAEEIDYARSLGGQAGGGRRPSSILLSWLSLVGSSSIHQLHRPSGVA